MAKSLEHMRGIDALPSTQSYKAAVAAARTSATRTPEERRAVQDQLEALRMKAMRDRNEQFALETNPFGKHGTLSKQIDKQLKGYDKFVQKLVNQQVANSAPKHARLIADVPSTCLESLTWKDGVATATFYRGGAVVYDYELSRDEFVEWVSFGSLGKYGNEFWF